LPQIFDTPIFSSDQSIDRVLNAGLPVVLVFHEGTVSPALDQTLKNLAKKEAGQLLVVQINAKDSPQAARRFNINAYPAVAAVKDGQALSTASSITGSELERHVSFLLGKGPRPQPEVQPQRPAASPENPQQTARSGGSAGDATGQPVTVTDATFDQEVMRSSLPVVVDFWAPWCGPCRMVAPVLDKLAREWNGKVKIAKINVDENPQAAGRYGVTGIPTMMVVSGGQIVDRWAGALPEAALRSRLAGKLPR
jgi:thioredoxin 1